MDEKRWAVFNNGAEIWMEYAEAEGAYHSGRCDGDVKALAARPHIAAQLDKIGHAAIVEELRGYGAWSEEELADEVDSRERFLWLAAGDIVDNPEFEGREIHNGEVE